METRVKIADPYEHTRGACDCQIHGGPDLFTRIADDEDIAIACRNAGMDAIVIKGHALDTARSAHFVNKHVPGIKVFGGVVLNWSVGGIDPAPAIASFEVGGKAVWLPTYDAKFHEDYFGGTGSNVYHGRHLANTDTDQSSDDQSGDDQDEFRNKKGISIIKDGKLTKSMIEVIEIVKEYNGFLGTSHVSPAEIAAIITYIRKNDPVNVLITHPEFMVPNCTPEFLKEVCGNGIYAEICTGIILPKIADHWVTVADQIKIIHAVGADNCIISSDGGVAFSPMPHETLRMQGRLLRDLGISNEELDLMMRVNPKRVLAI